MSSISLLRFHKDVELTQNRIDLITHFNPRMEIHGLYGGPASDFGAFQSRLMGLSSLTCLDPINPDAAWKRSDLCILEWYKKTGKGLVFDTVYTIEYDLLVLDVFENLIYLPSNTIALTGLIELKDIKENWDWITESPLKDESYQFLDYIGKTFGITNFSACLGPGSVLTKDFLRQYASIDLPTIAHDELRFPQLAKIFGINILDTGFYDNWNSVNPITESVFNCNKVEISIDKVLEEYKVSGRKVFHPVYKHLPINNFI